MDTDSVDIQPWPVRELVGQLAASAAVARRGAIEADVQADVYERETDRFELEAWSRGELVSWLTLSDFAILDSPAGALSPDHLERCHDALLECSTIAWAISALGSEGLPIFTDGEPERLAVAWAPGPWTAIHQVTRGKRPRHDDALAREREKWELIYWRLDLELPLDDETLEAIRETASEAASAGLLVVTHGDFTTDQGVPFHGLDIDASGRFLREAEVRLRTLNWVCGIGERLESAPLMLDDED